ncbi:molecular chaperone [Shewanella sp. 10N.286.45.A1]|uniref:TorD/DmsD family molecular chaperone n=1 Tax=Shewanella sp. 10N.286.45.A1 TaxID=3229694 RepID=UPI00354B5E8E
MNDIAKQAKPRKATFFDAAESAGIAKILSVALVDYPENDFIELLKDSEITKTWHMNADTLEYTKGLHHLSMYIEQYSFEELTRLKLDYGQLYFGAGMPNALPWGSCWLSEDQALNGDTTHELAAFFRANEINVTLKENQPIDHMGIILAVISQLLDIMVTGGEDGNKARLVLSILLSKHVLTWSDSFIAASLTHANTHFYIGMAYLLKDLLDAISSELGVFPATHVTAINQ